MGKSRSGSANGPKRPAGDKPLAAYVTSLTVENIRCFGPKQELKLTDRDGRPARWTLILGENGTGKTTLLESLVCTESIPLTAWTLEGVVTRPESRFLFSSSYPVEYVKTHGPNTPAVCSVAFVRTDSLGAGLGNPAGEVYWKAWSDNRMQVQHQGGPKFFAYGAGRRLAEGALVQGREDDQVGTLFDAHAQLRNAEEWLLQLELASLRPSDERTRHQARLKQIKELLTGGLLIDVDDIRFVSAPGPRPVAHVEFHTPYGWVPLRRLGYGYQTLIAWVVDFASRMVERYPDSPNPLHEPAIVVVDEIDLHLHPAWQRKLTTFLRDRFPNTQFIATAHSPLTVQAAEGANLAVLRRPEGRDYVEIVNDVDDIRNWRLDQIVTSDLFGLPTARPPWLDDLFRRAEKLAVKLRKSKAEKQELADIQARLQDLPTGDSAEHVRNVEAIREGLELLKLRSPHDPSQQTGGPDGSDRPGS